MKNLKRHLEAYSRWLTIKEKQGLNTELKTVKEYIERNISWKF